MKQVSTQNNTDGLKNVENIYQHRFAFRQQRCEIG